MPRSTVQHILGRLVDMGAVEARAQGRYIRYSVPDTPRGSRALVERELAKVAA